MITGFACFLLGVQGHALEANLHRPRCSVVCGNCVAAPLTAAVAAELCQYHRHCPDPAIRSAAGAAACQRRQHHCHVCAHPLGCAAGCCRRAGPGTCGSHLHSRAGSAIEPVSCNHTWPSSRGVRDHCLARHCWKVTHFGAI